MDVLEEISDREFYRRLEEEKRQHHLEEMRKAELERVSQLQDMVSDWERAQKIREFADGSKIKEEDLIQPTDLEVIKKSFNLIKYVKNQDDRGFIVTYIFRKINDKIKKAHISIDLF